MNASAVPSLLAVAAAFLCEVTSIPAGAEVFAWVDGRGVTHFTDNASQAPDGVETRANSLDELWTRFRAPTPTPTDRDAGRSDRTTRLIRGAVSDLGRGETARAAVALEAVLREQPGQPEAHWYLALLDRQRGRYDAARAHLEAFLASAGDDLEPWRQSAARRMADLDDESRLADPDGDRRTGPWLGLSNRHFRVNYDPELGLASPDYAQTVLRYLEQARETVSHRLGAVPEEAMGVVFYGKAAYLEAHRHRFSFETIGFFDGRIHVVSAAHPAGELRALLFHEYAHAVFREHTGGDRPYWLNEGLAELAERASLSRTGLTRSERAALRMRMDAGQWLSLRRLAPSFAGLDDAQARAAYLQSAAAASWIGERTTREQRARLLARLGQGVDADAALREILGIDTDGLDRAVQEQIRQEFPREAATEVLRRAPASPPEEVL